MKSGIAGDGYFDIRMYGTDFLRCARLATSLIAVDELATSSNRRDTRPKGQQSDFREVVYLSTVSNFIRCSYKRKAL